jgi:opacity protein-like surface antigen
VPGPLESQLTVKTTPAEVHKSPTVASTVIGKAQIGTVLDIQRNLGSWIEVPWPAGDGGVAFVHVSSGTIARRTTPAPVRVAAAAEPASAASMADSPAALADRIIANGQRNTAPSGYLLPPHVVGMGVRMNALTPGFGAGFGATMRTWWSNRLGLQVEVLHSRLGNLQGPGHVTSLQFAPSLTYAFTDAINSSFWARPYVGGGASLIRTAVSRPVSDLDLSASENGMGMQTFGGAEMMFASMPQFAISAELGYRWSQVSTIGFPQEKVDMSVSAHWYFK